MEQKVYFYNSKGDKLSGVLLTSSNKQLNAIVILCHGHGSNKNRDSYTYIVNKLIKNNISTFRFDFYGHGESEGKFAEATVSEAIDDILQAIKYVKDLSYKKIGLFGSSFGGLASIIAASKTDELSFLALKSPVSNYEEKYTETEGKKFLNNWKNKGFRKYDDSVDGKKLILNYSFYVDAINNNGYLAAPKINIPTIIVHGDKDDIVPIKQSIKTSRLIHDCQLVTIKDADHFYSQKKHNQRMFKTITDFLTQQAKK